MRTCCQLPLARGTEATNCNLVFDQLNQGARVQSVNTGKLVPKPAIGGVTAFGQRPVGAPVFVSAQAQMLRLVSGRLE
jgi:hypothetical protein